MAARSLTTIDEYDIKASRDPGKFRTTSRLPGQDFSGYSSRLPFLHRRLGQFFIARPIL
jgi:hypothetical protein